MSKSKKKRKNMFLIGDVSTGMKWIVSARTHNKAMKLVISQYYDVDIDNLEIEKFLGPAVELSLHLCAAQIC